MIKFILGVSLTLNVLLYVGYNALYSRVKDIEYAIPRNLAFRIIPIPVWYRCEQIEGHK